MIFFAYILLFSAYHLSGMSAEYHISPHIKETIRFFDGAAYEAYPMLFKKLHGQIQNLSHEQRGPIVGTLEVLAARIVEEAPSKATIYSKLLGRFLVAQGPALLLISPLRELCPIELDCSLRVVATAISVTFGGMSILNGWGSEPRKALFAYTISDKITALATAIKNNQPIGESGTIA